MGSTFISQLISCLIFFLFLTEVYAFDINCDNVNDRDSCLEIINDDELTDEEKEMLISALIYQSYYPDYDFIYDWNNNLELNYEGESNGFIYNAWVKIKGITPSVMINDELYCADEGKILADYDYHINMPDNVLWGECRTEWIKESETSRLSVYANGRYIGNEKELNFDINQDAEFTANLNVNLRTRLDHYRDVRYCCGRRNGRCVSYCTECRLYSSDIINHEVNVYDNLNVKYYGNEPEFNFEVLDNNDDLSFRADVINNSYLNINFDNSYYNSFNYFYGLNIDEDSLITLKAFPSNVTEIRNMIFSNGIFSVRNYNDCRIRYGDFFNSYEYDCGLDYEEYGLRIETDKLSYNIGETITVDIYPDYEDVRLSYGNETVIAQRNYEFEALPYHNRIESKLGNEESYKIIHVKDEDNMNKLFDFGVFFGFGYVLYLVCKKYYRGFV